MTAYGPHEPCPSSRVTVSPRTLTQRDDAQCQALCRASHLMLQTAPYGLRAHQDLSLARVQC